MKSYFATSFGDVCIESVGEDIRITTHKLTVKEEKVLRAYLSKEFKLNVDNLEDIKIYLRNITLEKVHSHLKKVLKGNKPTITAIKLSDDRLEIVTDMKSPIPEDGVALVTVERPARGCPMPEVTKEKEVRASAVLKEFLNPIQLRDFEKHKSIISYGNWSGDPYLITSRWSPKVSTYGQLYNLRTKEILCAECFSVPPSEEMLAMKLSIELREFQFLNTPHGEA